MAANTPMPLDAAGGPPHFGQELLRRFLSSLPGMVYRCRDDAHRTMEFASPGCRALTGFDARDLVKNRSVSFHSLVHPEDRDRVWLQVERAISAREAFQSTYRIRRVDGAERRVLERGWGVMGDNGTVDAIEGFIIDVTEQVGFAARSEDPGREAPEALQASVRHDLSNVFSVVKLTTELLMVERPDDAALSRDLQDILWAVEKGVEIVRQLARSGA